MSSESSNHSASAQGEVGKDADLGPLLAALKASIPGDKSKLQPFQVLAYLASETERRLADGRPLEIPTKDIYVDLQGNPNREPSAWLARLWREIDEKVYPQIQDNLIRHCRELGCSHFPRPRKADGSPAQYFIEAVPIAEGASPEYGQPTSAPTEDLSVIYEPDLTLQLSTIGNLAIKGGLAWTRGKKIAAATWFIVSLLMIAALALFSWLLLAYSKTPLTAQEIAFMILVVAMGWFVLRHLDRSTRVFEDRIVIAPDWLLAWKEFGATLEFERDSHSSDLRVFKVVRYTTKCPICGAIVRIEAGEPDFPRRLVGRCSESPREHVFSFDRVTRRGKPLISPF